MVQKVTTATGTVQTAIGNCSGYSSFNDIFKKYHKVVSERRVRPKGRGFVPPNEFFVEKYTLLNPEEDAEMYIYEGDSCLYRMTQFRHMYNSDSESTFEEHPFQPGILDYFYQDVRDNAVRDVYAKANAPAVFDSAPVLFELGETLIYCWRILGGLLRILKTAKFAAILKKGLLNPESIWLQYRYAIMPLILTISDAIEAYKGGVDKATYDARIELLNENGDMTKHYDFLSGGLIHRYEYVDNVSATARLYVKFQCDPHPLGMGLMDMVRGAWEIVPLSFVLDWFVGVGDWLTSIRNTKLELLGSYVTTVVDRHASASLDASYPISITGYSKARIHHYAMKREVDIVPPQTPILQAEHLSALRTADAITLIIAIAKGILSSKRGN